MDQGPVQGGHVMTGHGMGGWVGSGAAEHANLTSVVAAVEPAGAKQA